MIILKSFWNRCICSRQFSAIPIHMVWAGALGAPADITVWPTFLFSRRNPAAGAHHSCHHHRLRPRALPLGSGQHRPACAPPPLIRPNTLRPCAASSRIPAPLGFSPYPSGNGRWHRPSLEGRACRALRGAPETLLRWFPLHLLGFSQWWCTNFGFCSLGWGQLSSVLTRISNMLKIYVLCVCMLTASGEFVLGSRF